MNVVSKIYIKGKIIFLKLWTINIYPDLLPHNLLTSSLLWTLGKLRCDCLSWRNTVVPFSFSATPWVIDGVVKHSKFSWLYVRYASSCTGLEISIYGAEFSSLSLVKGYWKKSWFCVRLLLTAPADYVGLLSLSAQWLCCWGSEVHLPHDKHNNILKGYILKENRPLWDQSNKWAVRSKHLPFWS